MSRMMQQICSGGWVIVGDLPSAYFATDDSPNPAEALETYCVFMEDWTDRILNGEDLKGAYPIAAAPTEEHARMLKSRIEFIRQEIIPLSRLYRPVTIGAIR